MPVRTPSLPNLPLVESNGLAGTCRAVSSGCVTVEQPLSIPFSLHLQPRLAELTGKQQFIGLIKVRWRARADSERNAECPELMQGRQLLEVQAPGAVQYLLGTCVMVFGVVLPVVYAMLRKRTSSGLKNRRST